MKAIILAAGWGMRTYPVTKDTASPLLPVRGAPIIEYIVSKLEFLEGLEEIIVVTNNKFCNEFKEWAQSYSVSLPIKFINNGTYNHRDSKGSIRDLSLVLDKEILDSDVLVIGGDNLFSFMLDDFVEFSKAKAPFSAIGVCGVNGRLRAKKFGLLKLDSQGKVVDFSEKPRALNGLRLVSACIYYFSKDKLPLVKEYLDENISSKTIGEFIEWLCKRDTVYGYRLEGAWFDVGDNDAYMEAVLAF